LTHTIERGHKYLDTPHFDHKVLVYQAKQTSHENKSEPTEETLQESRSHSLSPYRATTI